MHLPDIPDARSEMLRSGNLQFFLRLSDLLYKYYKALHKAPDGSFTAYFLDEYTGQLEAQNEITSQDPEFSIEYCTDLCDSVWGDLWN